MTIAVAAATMTPLAASFYAENRRVRNERRVLGAALSDLRRAACRVP
jgi:hypothetical protein